MASLPNARQCLSAICIVFSFIQLPMYTWSGSPSASFPHLKEGQRVLLWEAETTILFFRTTGKLNEAIMNKNTSTQILL